MTGLIKDLFTNAGYMFLVRETYCGIFLDLNIFAHKFIAGWNCYSPTCVKHKYCMSSMMH